MLEIVLIVGFAIIYGNLLVRHYRYWLLGDIEKIKNPPKTKALSGESGDLYSTPQAEKKTPLKHQF